MIKKKLLLILISSCSLALFGCSSTKLDDTDVIQAAPKAAYQVSVETDNSEATELIQEHISLITQRFLSDLDEEQIKFLINDTPNEVQTIVETLGYFNSKTNVSKIDNGYLVKVNLGPLTQVEDVSVLINGPIIEDEGLPDYYRSTMASWNLTVAEPFTQDKWSYSKAAAINGLKRKKYPLAKIAKSEALINPENNTATVTINMESAKPIYFGSISVEGTQRYKNRIVRGLADFQRGDVYDLDKLVSYQQALEQDSHYSGAMVQADFNSIQDDQVPIKVSVTEVPKQKLDIGLRYDSEDGPGVHFGYDYYNLFNRGVIGSTIIDYNKYQKNVTVGLSQPRNRHGHFLTGSVGFDESTYQKLKTTAINSGMWYVRDRDGIESRLGVEYITESSKIEDGADLGRSKALMLTASWRRNNIETQLRPENGYFLEAKIGTTVGSLLSTASMQRIRGSASYYFTPEIKKYGTLILRGDLGYVRVSDDLDAPTNLLFRTGGGNTVRGYDYNAIGIDGENGSILGGKSMAVMSAEYQIPFKQDYAWAVFHDRGSVANKYKDFNWQSSTGIGFRWFSPFAPIAFDMSYAHETKKYGWQINLGTRF